MPPPMIRRMRLPERVMPSPRSHRRERRDDVGMDEIVALEKQRQVAAFRQRVGEAIAEVQIGGVPTAATETDIRRDGGICQRPSMPSFLDTTIPASVHVAELIIVASAYIRAAIVSASGSAVRKAHRVEVSTTIIVVQIGPKLVLRPLGIKRDRKSVV